MLDDGEIFMSILNAKRLHTNSNRATAYDDAGFTLVELLVVLAIIGLVAALVAPQVLRYLGSARVSTTQAQLNNIGSALELYYLDTGTYPSPDLGLDALVSARASAPIWNGPYLKTKSGLVDAWGKPFHYEQSNDGSGLYVKSYGRDGKPDGEGLDADLVFKVH